VLLVNSWRVAAAGDKPTEPLPPSTEEDGVLRAPDRRRGLGLMMALREADALSSASANGSGPAAPCPTSTTTPSSSSSCRSSSATAASAAMRWLSVMSWAAVVMMGPVDVNGGGGSPA